VLQLEQNIRNWWEGGHEKIGHCQTQEVPKKGEWRKLKSSILEKDFRASRRNKTLEKSAAAESMAAESGTVKH